MKKDQINFSFMTVNLHFKFITNYMYFISQNLVIKKSKQKQTTHKKKKHKNKQKQKNEAINTKAKNTHQTMKYSGYLGATKR